MTFIPSSGSVVAFQSDPTKLVGTFSVVGTLPVVLNNSSIIAVQQGSIATVIIGGSIAANFTPPANQSVSGTVGASIIGLPPVNVTNTNLNVSGSVAAWLNSSNASVITVGSPVANQSVSGAVSISNFPTTQNVSGSVVGFQGAGWSGSVAAIVTNTPSVTAIIANNNLGSVLSVDITATNNLKVEQDATQIFYDAWDTGTIDTVYNWQASVSGGNASFTPSIGQTLITSGNSASSFGVLSGKNNFQPVSPGFILVDHQMKYTYPPPTHTYGFFGVGSVVAVPTASIYANNAIGFEIPTSGGMNAVTIASQGRTVIQNLASISGTGAQPADGNTHRYELVIRGDTIFWQIDNKNVASILTGALGPDSNLLPVVMLTGTDSTGTAGPSSVLQLNSQAVYLGESTKAGNTITDKAHPQYTATVKPPATAVASVDGALAVGLHPSSPLPAGTNMIGSISGAVTIVGATTPPGSVSGTVGASIVGQLPAGTAVLGSVATLQGTNPWIVNYQNSSIIAISAGSVVSLSSGSVITVAQASVATVRIGQIGTQMTSVAGTAAANSASIISGLGFVTLGVRNDGMASVLATADGKYGPFTTGSWGDQIVSLAPSSVWTAGAGSIYTGVPQPIIGSVTGIFINVTGVQVANASANNVYLTFYGTGLNSVAGSIIGYTVAPANGGSNINFPIPLRTQVGQPFQASVSGVASVLISAQGFYSKV